ncbi:MAG TPA: PDZ domain-containing protein [Polyangiaceae bacterium]|nr:PDZ domain-containing protein [Polyangiaceae bacterium]
MKRSLLGSGILALVAFAPPAAAQSTGASGWLPPLPTNVAANAGANLGVTSAQAGVAPPGAGASPLGVTSPQAALPPPSGGAPSLPPGGPLPLGGPAPDNGPESIPYEDGAPAAPVDPQPTAQQLYEHVLRGVVALERNGVPMAIGTVLSGDGRVLTALSGLAGGDGADVRYADGTIVHAKVGRSDRANDLALLVPASLKWTEGLMASDVDPAGQDLRAMLPALPGKPANLRTHLGPAIAAVKGQVDAHARDGGALLRMLDVDLKGVPVAGAPLLDSTGSVVGVLVRACKGAAPAPASDDSNGTWYPTQAPAGAAAAAAACKPIVLGAPVAAIRTFLSYAAKEAAPAPWLGIRGEPEHSGTVHGVRVVAVAPSSPAEKAALKSGSDVIVAVDGHPIDTNEKLADLIAKHAPGDSVKLLVFSADQFREVAVALRAAP